MLILLIRDAPVQVAGTSGSERTDEYKDEGHLLKLQNLSVIFTWPYYSTQVWKELQNTKL